MTKIYHSLPGLGTGRGNLQAAVRNRVYRGPDHLLIVQSTGYTEEYKRIFFRDIRYVEIRKNNQQIWQGFIAAAFIALFLFIYFLGAPLLVACIFGLPFLIWLIINMLRGPGCDCHISTSVQTLKMPTPGRINKVPVLINFLRTEIAAESASPGQPIA